MTRPQRVVCQRVSNEQHGNVAPSTMGGGRTAYKHRHPITVRRYNGRGVGALLLLTTVPFGGGYRCPSRYTYVDPSTTTSTVFRRRYNDTHTRAQPTNPVFFRTRHALKHTHTHTHIHWEARAVAPCSRAHTTYTCTRYSIAQRKTIESRRKIPAPTRMQFNDCVRARGRPGDERTNHAGDRNNAFLSTCSRGPRIYTFSAPSSSRGSKSRSPPLFYCRGGGLWWLAARERLSKPSGLPPLHSRSLGSDGKKYVPNIFIVIL